MEIAILILLITANALLAVVLVRMMNQKPGDTEGLSAWLEPRLNAQSERLEKKLNSQTEAVESSMSRMRSEMLENSMKSTASLNEGLQSTIQRMGQQMSQNQLEQGKLLENRMQTLETTSEQKLESMRVTLNKNMEAIRTENGKTLEDIRSTVSNQLTASMEKTQAASTALSESLQSTIQRMSQQMSQNQLEQGKLLENRMQTLETTSERKLESMRVTLNQNMDSIRSENNKKLDEIRHTVDEQLQDALQKRLTQSFETVSRQLEQVYKGLGEMQTLATDVGGLKQVLSGVKTRGILGEIQLGSILEEILAPEQYETNVATVPGSSERVEYAVRMPGADGGKVWLPIDAKFPGDTYVHLQEAYQSGDKTQIEAARHALEKVVRSEAKDIRTKYVAPPDTTNFGIMFLPFEGLYAEVVNLGLVEVLQRDFQVNIAGPSTMAALLNSLQMGFRTLAIQKRSNEVWQVLAAVKTEFEKFADGLGKMQTRLRQTEDEMDKLIGVRTRAINRKLRGVQKLDSPETATQLLELDKADWDEETV